ncbi:aconitase family protein, partial [Staphylococcus aureus]|uniref:aconitase family protein n=1 Tax=Staphylococcus aureus TaxID=1280 RepID=UPI003F986C84
YLNQNHMFFDVENEDHNYTDVIELDLSTVEASLSGPKRPQDLIFLSDMNSSFENSVTAPACNQGHGLDISEFDKKAEINFKDGS